MIRATLRYWWTRLMQPSFCMHCDKPVRRRHYRKCNCRERADRILPLIGGHL